MTSVFTVLVADDQREVLTIISNWLRQAGHVAVCASSGREAMALLRSMHVDALITDLVMPNGNGLELIMDARSERPSMRIAAISSSEQTEAALAAGADACLRKPLMPEVLLRALGTPAATT
jgi:CheY-like chemotaxis protein